jgi:eukaryotic-like serine/threonine-protein kinase
MMTPERWRQIKELLAPALDLDPAKQPEYLDQACGSDVSLRQELERLLAAERDASPEFLNASPIPLEFIVDLPPRAEPWIGRRLGSYEIVEEIGCGGMGEVYRAVRADDEFRKQVAVKLVRSGQDSSFILNRFRNERQILAGLDHPNIARLLDGGTTKEGVPYFVMELVEGQRIDEYCDAHDLSTDERLELFLEICSAVQYAHQRLIVHRDIKPGNILVTADGAPKLLDFGIAKIVESSDSSIQPEQTMSVFRLLTPEYASPEQVRSETITTASDVYSLGVVLYELLTGGTPYRVATRTPHEISIAVCEAEPEKPSVAVRRPRASANGHGSVASSTKESSSVDNGSVEKLSRSLRGDLDNIVLMALRKEPRRRYASVEQFAGDIRRYLTKLPITARKDTASYRASKFVSRHKAGVASAALMTVALLTAMGVILREYGVAQAERARAEHRFNDVRKLANSLMFEIHDSIKDLPGSTPSRKLLVSRALEYLDSLSQEAKGDASLLRELAAAYEKIGDVQGQPRQANLGDTAGAESSYRKGLAILDALAAADPRTLDLQRELVPAYGKLSDLLWFRGDNSGSMENARKGLAVTEALYRADSANAANRMLFATYHMDYGFKQALVAGDRAGGLETLRQGSQMLERIASEDPKNIRARRFLALSYARAASILEGNASDRQQALTLYEQSIATLQPLLANEPNNIDFGRIMAYHQFQMAQLLANMGEVNKALTKEREALASFQKLAAADPTNLQFRQDVAQVRALIGEILTRQGDLPGAMNELNSSLASVETVPDAKNPQSLAGFVYLSDQYWLGEARAQMASAAKTRAEKRELCRKAESWFQKCLPGFKVLREHPSPQWRDTGWVADIEKEIAQCERVLGRTGSGSAR